jgi:translation initiation factor 3 subunit A
MTIDRFKSRIAGIGLKFYQVEKILTQAVRARHLSVRFDHQNKCIRFESDTMEATRMKSQLTTLAKKLTLVVTALDKTPSNSASGDSKKSKEALARKRKLAFIASCKKQAAEDNLRAIKRKEKIEQMKNAYEKRQLEEARLAADLKKKNDEIRREKERLRRIEEAKKREEDRLDRIEKKKQLMAKRKLVEDSGIKLTENQLQNMTGEELLKRRQELAIKEHRKAASKMREQSKKIDYLCRALRDEERPLLLQRVSEMKASEKKYFETKDKETREKHRKKWEDASKSRDVLKPLLPFADQFTKFVLDQRKAKLEANKEKEMLFQKLKKMRAKYERARKRMLEAEAVEREEKRKAEEAIQKQKEEEAKAKALEEEEGSSGGGRWQKRTLGNSSSGHGSEDRDDRDNDRASRDGEGRRGGGLRRGASNDDRDFNNNYPERRDDKDRRDYDRGYDRDGGERRGGLRRGGFGDRDSGERRGGLRRGGGGFGGNERRRDNDRRDEGRESRFSNSRYGSDRDDRSGGRGFGGDRDGGFRRGGGLRREGFGERGGGGGGERADERPAHLRFGKNRREEGK